MLASSSRLNLRIVSSSMLLEPTGPLTLAGIILPKTDAHHPAVDELGVDRWELKGHLRVSGSAIRRSGAGFLTLLRIGNRWFGFGSL